MNIISPQEHSKPTAAAASITAIPTLPFQVEANPSQTTSKIMCPVKDINAYALFLVLEKQRNMKLRELYRNAPSVEESSSTEQQQQECDEVALPKLPPRYQNLKVTADWLMLKLRLLQRPTSQAANEYKALDQVTKAFLDDTVRVLQAHCDEQAIKGCLQPACDLCSSTPMPPLLKHRSSITITPPSSPRRVPRITLTEEEPPLIPLSLPPSEQPIDEVDLTDDQIMSLYEIVPGSSSGDAVFLNDRLI